MVSLRPERNTGVGSLGVACHVGLGARAHVAGHGKGAAHHDHAADGHHRRRIALQGKRQIGERASRNVDQIGAIGTRGINQVIDRRLPSADVAPTGSYGEAGTLAPANTVLARE